jgi:glycerol-3-phosphate dehydrogenase
VSTTLGQDVEVAVIGAGVVGCAVTLALARRQVNVALLEAEPEPGLWASGTNSGILHTGFDSAPGELETELILAAARRRDPVIAALGVPVLPCGAVMRPRAASERAAVRAIAANARRNGVEVHIRPGQALEIPGEAVTDPVFYTLALASAARRHGAELRMSARVEAIERAGATVALHTAGGDAKRCRAAVNCAGLEADSVARLAGDDSLEIYPRKGEFLVFDPLHEQPLERILLPVPSKATKGVLVFPTVDGKVVAGPTAVDQEDKRDWSVRPDAWKEIIPKAAAMYPPLGGAEPIAAYAGLRPAGRGANYVIGPSRTCPSLVNVAAIRSTGLSASLGIAERVTEIVGSLGVPLGPEQDLKPGPVPALERPWWRRTADFRESGGQSTREATVRAHADGERGLA